jgi:hypothetical protein
METATQAKTQTIDLSQISAADLEALLLQKKKEERDNKMNKRAAYEGIRADVVLRIEQKARQVASDVRELFTYVCKETAAFYEVMKEYGMLRADGQLSYTLQEENFKIEVKTNKVKKFDERADVAAARLIEFLLAWIQEQPQGTDNPMYQLAMTMLERNKNGDLDYKQVSNLYDLEEKFNRQEYTDIMLLFKESHLIEGTAINFYFWQKNSMGVWTKLEPSFNRL